MRFMLGHWVAILAILSVISKYELIKILIIQWNLINVTNIIYIMILVDAHKFLFVKAIPGVNKIKDGYNPATWMLEVSSSSQELALGVDFTDIYRGSELYR